MEIISVSFYDAFVYKFATPTDYRVGVWFCLELEKIDDNTSFINNLCIWPLKIGHFQLLGV